MFHSYSLDEIILIRNICVCFTRMNPFVNILLFVYQQSCMHSFFKVKKTCDHSFSILSLRENTLT